MLKSKLRSIKQLKNINNKRVLVRCNFDVPLKQNTKKNKQRARIKVTDDSRLRTCLPTVEYLLKKKARIILIGHLGRPQGKVVKALSLKPVKKRLEKLLNQKLKNRKQKVVVKLINIQKYVGQEAFKAVKEMQAGQIIMLENLRFSDREKANCKRFARKLASLADIYVNNAFSVAHREHASIQAIQNFLPVYYGLNFVYQVQQLAKAIKQPVHPLVLIIGGAKIETKLPVIEKFIKKADYILIGGAVANNFIKAFGFKVGKSLINKAYLKQAKQILNKAQQSNCQLLVPIDVTTQHGLRQLKQIKKQDIILDIGPQTRRLFKSIIKIARMVIWNGPLGKFEDKKFRIGTQAIAEEIVKAKIWAVIGGGETKQIFKNKKLKQSIFISSGGGAMLDFLALKNLPAFKN